MYNLSKFYKNKKILITGVTGFKGAWLAKCLIGFGCNVHGIGYNPNKNKNLFYQLKLNKKINFNLFDIRNSSKLKSCIYKIKPSIIFHLAAQPLISESYKKPLLTFDVNFRGTLNLLDICKDTKFVRSIIVVTSDKCYESNNSTKGFKETDLLGGVDPYSASKSATEIMVRAYRKSFFLNKKIGLSTVRAGNVIGGGDWSVNRLIPDTVRSLLKRKKIILRNPNFNRPWQHVLEPLKGYLILAKLQFKNQKKYSSAWNFGTRPNSLTSVSEIVKIIIKYWGSGVVIERKNKFYEQQNLQLNIKKAHKLLKWLPTYNIKKSVLITAEWYFKVLKLKYNPKKVTEDQIKSYFYESGIN